MWSNMGVYESVNSLHYCSVRNDKWSQTTYVLIGSSCIQSYTWLVKNFHALICVNSNLSSDSGFFFTVCLYFITFAESFHGMKIVKFRALFERWLFLRNKVYFKFSSLSYISFGNWWYNLPLGLKKTLASVFSSIYKIW